MKMITNYSNICNAQAMKSAPTRTRYRRPVALVFGEERGIPFRLCFKSWKAAENCFRSHFGSQLITL